MRQTLVVDASRVTILMKGTDNFFFAVLFKKPTSKVKSKLKSVFFVVLIILGERLFSIIIACSLLIK